ncbi:hypothetical protein PDIDSM_1590 [Penicillium digitatum]|nr:hypothetical protein PDIDSM_1590 [Penicillium digitatum]
MRQPTEEFTPGYGGLFTLQFEDAEMASVFFNALNVHKGPSLEPCHTGPALRANGFSQAESLGWGVWPARVDRPGSLAVADNSKASRVHGATGEMKTTSGASGMTEKAATILDSTSAEDMAMSEKR